MADERTSLFSEARPGPSYVFPGRNPRSRQRQARKYQCCICTTFLGIFIIALILTISYTIMDSINGINNNNNDTTQTQSNPTLLWLLNERDNSTAMDLNSINITDIYNFLLLKQWPLTDEPIINWTLPAPTIEQRENAIKYGLKSLGDRELFEEDMMIIPFNTPSYRHQKAVSITPEARKLTKRGYVENYATIDLAIKSAFEKKPGQRSNIGIGPPINFGAVPPKRSACNFNSKYRYSTGICNNKKHPFNYGVAMLPFRRALHPDYADGISTPRESHSLNSSLPSARDVSINIHRPSHSVDPKFTVMLAIWGQFLDHDITATALNQGSEGEPIDCCHSPLNKTHPECYPVQIHAGDPYYDTYNISCMNFVRSSPAPTGHFGPRQQLNQATSFIDGSVVYGSTDQRVNSLRSLNNGLLRMFIAPDNRTLLPISRDPSDGCNEDKMNKQGKYCFESGDSRANENLYLTSMHLIWARHHNYLATNLHALNPHWTDELVFQEARKILSAQLQHITYNEFLPIVLGEELCKKVGILSKTNNNSDTYDSNIDPSIANVFAASAFRFAHTLLPGMINATNEETLALHTMLFNPYSLWANKGLDNALQGAIATNLARSDPYFTTELTEKLFEKHNHSSEPQKTIINDVNSTTSDTNSENDKNSTMGDTNSENDTNSTISDSDSTSDTNPHCGLDLVTLNIQRGRDHGLPSYTEWRKYCKLPPTDTWETMKAAVNPQALKHIMTIYSDAIDVDTYTGALSEDPLPGAIVGPLLTCLITDQFLRIKNGDSHWYERPIGSQRFSKDQLNEIYNTTLSEIICRNSDAVTNAQKYVMQTIDQNSNAVVDCTAIDKFDFTPWIDNKINNTKWKNSVKIDSQKSNIIMLLSNNNTATTDRNITKL